MPKLFHIEYFTLGRISIGVQTNKGIMIVNRAKFEDWVDRDDKRADLTWAEYYPTPACEDALYDYLVIRGGSRMFLDIYNSVQNICANP